jgi:hypothetical protein
MMNEQKKFDADRDERLRAMLLEDTDSAEEAEMLFDTVQHIRSWSVPEATSQMTAQLLDKLLPEMPVSQSARDSLLSYLHQCWPLLLIRSQLRVVKREIWAASALVMTLGVVVTVALYNGETGSTMPLVILAPVIAAVGVAFLYDTEYEQMLEIENTTAVSSKLLMLARLTLVFGFDLALALIGSILLAIFHADVLLWPLVLSWLTPMAFLSALAFLLSVMIRDALAGSVFALLVWGLHVFLGSIPDPNRLLFVLSLPGLSAPESRPLLFVAAGLCIALALYLVGRSERSIGASL